MQEIECLMIETKNKKLFIEESALPQIIEFCKLNKNKIFKVKLLEGNLLSTKELASQICDANSQKDKFRYETINQLV